MSQLLEVQGLSFAYETETVLRDISFSLGQGEYISLIGPNGSGKSTLLNLLSGYHSIQAGSLLLKGKPLPAYSVLERARIMAVVSQHKNLDFPFTCMELVALGLYPHKSRFERMSDEQLEAIQQVMEVTDTLPLSGKLISKVSGGERQRVVLARALLQRPKLLLLDEAMSDLDIAAKISMAKCLKAMVKEKKISILAINHDLANAYQFSDRILLLRDGRLIGNGVPAEVITEQSLELAFAVRAKIRPGEGIYIYDNLID